MLQKATGNHCSTTTLKITMINNNNDMASSLRQAEHHPPVQPEGVRRIRRGKTERRNNGRKGEQYRVAMWNVRTLYQSGKIVRTALQGKIIGKAARGRRKLTILSGVKLVT